jgi:putative PEP-CTERM system histidine kinase
MFEILTMTVLAVTGAAFMALVISLRPGVVPAAPRLRLRVAALITALWCGLAAWVASRPFAGIAVTQLMSVALSTIWLWQLEPLARWQGHRLQFRRLITWLGPAVIALAVLAPAFDWRPSLVTAAGLLLCVFGLAVIEQLYRNAAFQDRLAFRWLGLGVGAVFLTEMVIFAQLLLVGVASQVVWPIRGAAYIFAAFAINRGARRMPDWSFGLSVSRQIVFHASSFVLIGVFLLLMTAAGRLLLQHLENLHEAILVGSMLVAIAGLAITFFLGRIQRRIKVLIAAHFYPHRYDYRAEWLRFSRTLSQPGPDESLPQRSIRAVAQIVDARAGTLWRQRRGSPHFEAIAAWPGDEPVTGVVGEDEALPAFMARTGWLVDTQEMQSNPEIYAELTAPSVKVDATEALIVPLMHVERLYGWVVLRRPRGLATLNFEDRDLLKTVGRQVAAHLSQFDADAQLVEAHQFETYNRMTAFVMHDLKNIAAQLRLISQNAERHRQNPEFVEDAFRTVATAAIRMTKLIAQLTSGTDGGTMQTLDLGRCAERAAVRCSGTAPVPQLQVLQEAVVFADYEKLTSIIEHAVKNAQDATPANGEVRIEILARDGQPVLRVMDNGAGMDARFIRERLFRPFDTTKGSRGMGIGAFQVREYMRSLGGDVEVESQPGRGSAVSLVFARQTLGVTADGQVG